MMSIFSIIVNFCYFFSVYLNKLCLKYFFFFWPVTQVSHFLLFLLILKETEPEASIQPTLKYEWLSPSVSVAVS